MRYRKKLKDFHDPPDLRKEPLTLIKGLEEILRKVSVSILGGRSKGTTYEFSTSNQCGASLETLDFIPLTTVDYSGGMIITDWYSDNSSSSNEL